MTRSEMCCFCKPRWMIYPKHIQESQNKLVGLDTNPEKILLEQRNVGSDLPA
jgi:hypothetical protein